MEPFMIYTGNHLFHYTKFESALKIIATKTLRFGDFSSMNDIAESGRGVFGMISTDIIDAELGKYRSISMTLDDSSRRGFSIDPLWGHYAQGGNGVCLVFDKNRLTKNLNDQFGKRATIAPIKYLHGFTNAIFTTGNSATEVERYIEDNIDDIFYTKSIDWEYEHELRILIKDQGQREALQFENDTLITAILCLPKANDYKEAAEYKILRAMLLEKPILHYTTSLGNKELLNEDEGKMCGIIDVDWHLPSDLDSI